MLSNCNIEDSWESFGLQGQSSRKLTLNIHCTGDRDQEHPQEKEMQKKQNGYVRRLKK